MLAGTQCGQYFLGLCGLILSDIETKSYFIGNGLKNIGNVILIWIVPELEGITMFGYAGWYVYQTYLEKLCYEKALEHIQTTGERSFDIECDYISY